MAALPGLDERDFRGYGNELPQADWPGGARVAVSVVINVEEGSERSIRRGDAVNEPVYDMLANVPDAADPAMESHFDYGTRVGYWRIMRVLEQYGVPATLSICGEVAELSPWMLQDAVARGHELACHGWRWQGHDYLNADEERRQIALTVDTIRAATGVAPRGWHTRTPASVNTRRLLVEHGGFLYDSDAYDDDLPRLVDSGRTVPHVIMPYSLDTNDMRFQLTNGFRTGQDFADYVTAAYDWLYDEAETAPRMMSIGLHLRIVARPARIGGLAAILAHIGRRGGAWFARRDAIAQHWLDRFGSA